MTPSIDRNEAPETWITAAPFDTLTLRDKDGRPVDKDGKLLDPGILPAPTDIPVRFHIYWAGSDKDGAVVGFYYAVVETTVVPVDGFFAPLPGPKPGQYRFTTKTDTTFVFTVSEMFADRKHALFVYAVDNQGKPDATPARFIFNARDDYPPRPVFDVARAYGETVRLTASGEPISDWGYYPMADNDTLILGKVGVPKVTVPAGSRLDFEWHDHVTQIGAVAVGYRFKLDSVYFSVADSATRAVSYGTGVPGSAPVSPGVKVFTLQALDQAGGGTTVTRLFRMNFAPDTWWAGPDPDDFTGPSDGEYDSHSVTVASWPGPDNPVFDTNPSLSGLSTFGPDSFTFRPSKRFPPKRDFERRGTFYEIYKNRLYARTEGDTVHQNSFVVLWNGGYDRDSRYIPRISRYPSGSPTDPWLSGQTGDVLTADDRVGSPIGFRSQISTRLTPLGLVNAPAQTTIYPVFEPASVFRSVSMGGYWRMNRAGKAFAVARAEDADGALDNSVGDQVKLADDVDKGLGTPEQVALRNKVLVFYVDKAPALVRDPSLFRPREGESITTEKWTFLLRGMDLDPFDSSDLSVRGGGPTSKTILRYSVTLYGKSLTGPDETSWTYLDPISGLRYIQTDGRDVTLTFTPGGTMAKNPFASGPIRVSIQICDCSDCETVPGQGRCVDGLDPQTKQVPSLPGYTDQNVITVNYTRPAGALGLGDTSSTGGRPGSDPSGGRD
jgi:hypothetical protein